MFDTPYQIDTDNLWRTVIGDPPKRFFKEEREVKFVLKPGQANFVVQKLHGLPRTTYQIEDKYLSGTEKGRIRIRYLDEKPFLTIKQNAVWDGVQQVRQEAEIPLLPGQDKELLERYAKVGRTITTEIVKDRAQWSGPEVIITLDMFWVDTSPEAEPKPDVLELEGTKSGIEWAMRIIGLNDEMAVGQKG